MWSTISPRPTTTSQSSRHDENNRFLSTVAELDVPVIFGDATLPQTLASARVDRARAVAVMTRGEVVNIEIGIVLAKMLGRRLRPRGVRPDVPLVLRVYDRALSRAVANRFGFVNVRSTIELAAPSFISAAIGLDVLGAFSVGQSAFVVGAMQIVAGSELDGIRMPELPTKTRFIAITRPDSPVKLHPRRDVRLRADDTVYVVGPYRELLETLRKGRFPQEEAHAGGQPRREHPNVNGAKETRADEAPWALAPAPPAGPIHRLWPEPRSRLWFRKSRGECGQGFGAHSVATRPPGRPMSVRTAGAVGG